MMSTLDIGILSVSLAAMLIIGLWAGRNSGSSTADYFLSGRSMPWWLLGVSMVATTFSADTPNLVTDIVRKEGVSGNWVWWAYLLTGMLTVYVYARLWRRSGITTDLEFYELRYSGPEAKFLRIFRALYLGILFNILVMATVCLAAIKIGAAMFGLMPIHTLLIASLITLAYSSVGGLRSVIWTDLFQFILAMVGTLAAAYYIVQMPQIGGLSSLIDRTDPDVLRLVPSMDQPSRWWSLLILPLTVQWWASYYPGSEPGGGGYIVQRMLASKDEKNAQWATLFFNIAHYALRPWPWIIIAIASLIIFPDLASLQAAYPEFNPSVVQDDLAYPAMLKLLPTGLIGLVFASLAAAFMSTISTHLNWGASYLVHDVYRAYMSPDRPDRHYVWIGRLATVGLMVLAAYIALFLKSAKEIFDLIVLLGAGTGLIYILRWLWWRINAYSEISAMIVSFIMAGYMQGVQMESGLKLLISVGVTTVAWLIVTFLTRPTDEQVLLRFYERIRPYPAGWKPVAGHLSISMHRTSLIADLLRAGLAALIVYAALFSTGYVLYSQWYHAAVSGAVGLAAFIYLRRV